jgi:hypothetical protein
MTPAGMCFDRSSRQAQWTGTFGNLLPEIEYRDYVRNAHDQLHVVLNDEKGHTRRLEEPVLAVHGLAKNFGGVRALSGIDMTISRGIGAE